MLCVTWSDSVLYCVSAGQRRSGGGIQETSPQFRPAYRAQSWGEQETDPGVGWRTPPRRQGRSTRKIIPQFTKQAYLDEVNCFKKMVYNYWFCVLSSWRTPPGHPRVRGLKIKQMKTPMRRPKRGSWSGPGSCTRRPRWEVKVNCHLFTVNRE